MNLNSSLVVVRIVENQYILRSSEIFEAEKGVDIYGDVLLPETNNGG